MSRLECERWASLLDREALEGALTRDDVVFQTEHPRSCENCAHELAAWRELGALNPTQTSALERDVALEEAALNQLWREAPAPGIRVLGRPRITLAVTLVVLAAAAAVLLFVSRQRQTTEVAGQLAHATLGSGRALDDGGVAHLAGEVVRTGARLRAEAEPLCLLVEPAVRACLSPGGELKVADLTLAHRRIELLRGRLVTSLEPQPEGSTFSVSTASTTVTAVGTIFTVEVAPDHEQVLVRVLHGKVKVRSSSQQERLLEAHQSLALGTQVGGEVSSQLEQSDLALLRMDPLPVSSAVTPAPALSLDVPVHPPPAVRPNASPGTSANAPASPSSLLREAVELRARGRFAEAAQAYRKLLTDHPGSAEARAGLVSLGDLQLSRLQQADAALRSFDAYLKSGDRGLAQEAEYGRIRAFRALGRAQEERRAIEQLLARYPSGVHSESMRGRLVSLKGNAPD